MTTRKNSKNIVKGGRMTEAQEYAATNVAYRAAIKVCPNDYSTDTVCTSHEDRLAAARALLAGKRYNSRGELV